MKRILLIAAGVMMLAGCDVKSQALKSLPSQDTLSIAEMIATGKEAISSECKKSEGSFNCEFLTGDLTEPGKWHHTQLNLYQGGEADMAIDGNLYHLYAVESKTSAKQETTSFLMKGVESGRGEIKIVRSDEGKLLNFDAYDSDNKHYTKATVKLN